MPGSRVEQGDVVFGVAVLELDGEVAVGLFVETDREDAGGVHVDAVGGERPLASSMLTAMRVATQSALPGSSCTLPGTLSRPEGLLTIATSSSR